MQIKYGNLLDVEQGVIVHGCNNQGVMGSGIAKAIKERWPNVYEFYREEWKLLGGFDLGDAQFIWVDYNKIICNGITQNTYGHTGQHVDYLALGEVFTKALAHAKVDNLPIHYPLIGVVRGGGSFKVISEIIDNVLDGHEHYLWILPEEKEKFEKVWSKS